MSEEESFTPASRLNRDSVTSPNCATTAITIAATTSCDAVSPIGTRARTTPPYTSAATTAPTTPPIAPAHVFRGDKTGESFGPPTNRPAAMAAVSRTQVITSGTTASANDP